MAVSLYKLSSDPCNVLGLVCSELSLENRVPAIVKSQSLGKNPSGISFLFVHTCHTCEEELMIVLE